MANEDAPCASCRQRDTDAENKVGGFHTLQAQHDTRGGNESTPGHGSATRKTVYTKNLSYGRTYDGVKMVNLFEGLVARVAS